MHLPYQFMFLKSVITKSQIASFKLLTIKIATLSLLKTNSAQKRIPQIIKIRTAETRGCLSRGTQKNSLTITEQWVNFSEVSFYSMEVPCY